jgi:hypothetical protein
MRRKLQARLAELPAPAPYHRVGPGEPTQAAACEVRWGRAGLCPSRRQRLEGGGPWVLATMVLLALGALAAPCCAARAPAGTNCQPTTLTYANGNVTPWIAVNPVQAAGSIVEGLRSVYSGRAYGPSPGETRNGPESWLPQPREQAWGLHRRATPGRLVLPGGDSKIGPVVTDFPADQASMAARGHALVNTAPFGSTCPPSATRAGQQLVTRAREGYGGLLGEAVAGKQSIMRIKRDGQEASSFRLVWRRRGAQFGALGVGSVGTVSGSDNGETGTARNWATAQGNRNSAGTESIVGRRIDTARLRSWSYAVAHTRPPSRFAAPCPRLLALHPMTTHTPWNGAGGSRTPRVHPVLDTLHHVALARAYPPEVPPLGALGWPSLTPT